MWFRVADKLGCTVKEAMVRCDPDEFVEWWGYYLINPWGGERTDLAIAINSSLLANINRGDNEPFAPVDFLKDYAAPYRVDNEAESIEAEREYKRSRVADKLEQWALSCMGD